MAKQYGLIKSDKSKVIIRPSIFNESSDSDDANDRPTGIQTLKKKERIAQDKILAEDPTVYQYDELYDEIQSQRKDSKLARKDLDKKPKYISKLLETAERRKKENERRIERQVQKERDEEGDLYKDKESFVTSAYRKKLEEMKELEEKEKREEYLESIGDVKKQGDLSGFYRHLYAQQVNFDEEKQKSIKKEPSDSKSSKSGSNSPDARKIELTKPSNRKEPSKDRNSNPSTSKAQNLEPSCSKDQPSGSKDQPSGSKTKRKYRKREDSRSSESEEEQKLEHLPSNLDADSDFSIDSDSESDSEPKKPKIAKKEAEVKETVVEVKVEVKKEVEEVKKEVIEVVKKPKKDIWKKRTVGDVFDEALKRYYERKAARMISV